jgi:predicted nucleotidyltransferase
VPSIATLERLLAACGHHLTVSTEPATRLGSPSVRLLRRRRSELLAVAERHGARNVRVFGSTARNQARPDSDIDLLVELDPGRTLLDLVALRRDLTRALGRPVDVATDEMLSRPARVQAESEAVPL